MADSKSLIYEDFVKNLEDMYKPKVSQELAIDLASRLYGLEVIEIKPMNSFSDQNFFIKVSKDHQNPHIEEISDQGYTLKIINTFKSNLENHFDSVHEGMAHLFQKGLRVPQPVKNIEGKTWQLEVVPLQEKPIQEIGKKQDKILKCGVHLLTYIPGVPVATFKNTEDNFFEWGTLLAKFHTALEDLDCPALNTKKIFSNGRHFNLIRSFLANLDEGAFDEEAKSLVENVLDRYPSELEIYLEVVPQGIIHGDFNDHNILAQLKDDTYSADGILDFDDMHGGAYAWDLGLMLAHILMVDKTTDPLEAAGHAVAGYRSLRHLSDQEISLLKICMECRLSMMTLISAAAKDDPTNSYIALLSALGPKRNMLKRLARTKVEKLLSLWNEIIKKRNVDVQ